MSLHDPIAVTVDGEVYWTSLAVAKEPSEPGSLLVWNVRPGEGGRLASRFPLERVVPTDDRGVKLIEEARAAAAERALEGRRD